MDWRQQAEYWRATSSEDMALAVDLLNSGRRRYALFFAHLALEKALKALIASKEGQPPKIHNLLVLAEKAGLNLEDSRRVFLARMNEYQIEGRYPEQLGAGPSALSAERDLAAAQEAWTWLRQL